MDIHIFKQQIYSDSVTFIRIYAVNQSFFLTKQL